MKNVVLTALLALLATVSCPAAWRTSRAKRISRWSAGPMTR